MTDTKQRVLLIGSRGFLGSKVLDAVVKKNKYIVKAMVRGGKALSSHPDIPTVAGDMMDPESLKEAFENIDVVVSTANGYMSGHMEVDKEGSNNVIDACKAAGIKRYVFCSVLTADLAEEVEHFHVKKLAEDYMKEKEIPFVALRPGAFLDQAQDYLGDGIKRGDSFAVSVWNKTIPIGMIYTPDLAQAFADAIDLPKEANGCSIDLGWSRPIAMEEVVSIASAKLDKQMSCYTFPKFLRSSFIYTIGYLMPMTGELFRMFNYFDTGVYVNNTDLQEKFFGKPPTPEDAIHRYVDKLLAEKEEKEQGEASQ